MTFSGGVRSRARKYSSPFGKMVLPACFSDLRKSLSFCIYVFSNSLCKSAFQPSSSFMFGAVLIVDNLYTIQDKVKREFYDEINFGCIDGVGFSGYCP